MYFRNKKIALVTKRIVLVILISVISLSKIYSQGKIKQINEKRDSAKALAVEQGKPWLSPIFAPAFTSDAGVVVAGGILYSFKIDRNDSISQRSSLPASVFYSSKGNFGVRSNVKTFWFNDKFRVNLNLDLTDKDNNYFGKGYDKIDNTKRSDSITLYHETVTDLDVDVIYKIAPSLYAGLRLRPGYKNMRDAADSVENDPYKSQFKNSYFLNSIGFQVSYDTRDIVINPWKGIFLNFSALFYNQAWASDYNYQIYTFDFRYYRKLNRGGNVLAFRFYTRSTYGDVPITELSDFSGGKYVRGYPLGKYRDNACALIVGEWRHTFFKRDKTQSKHGIVLWGGTSSIASDVGDMTKWLPNVGVGYRFELQPRMNICIDFGAGDGSQGVYFNFNEAF